MYSLSCCSGIPRLPHNFLEKKVKPKHSINDRPPDVLLLLQAEENGILTPACVSQRTCCLHGGGVGRCSSDSVDASTTDVGDEMVTSDNHSLVDPLALLRDLYHRRPRQVLDVDDDEEDDVDDEDDELLDDELLDEQEMEYEVRNSCLSTS